MKEPRGGKDRFSQSKDSSPQSPDRSAVLCDTDTTANSHKCRTRVNLESSALEIPGSLLFMRNICSSQPPSPTFRLPFPQIPWAHPSQLPSVMNCSPFYKPSLYGFLSKKYCQTPFYPLCSSAYHNTLCVLLLLLHCIRITFLFSFFCC